MKKKSKQINANSESFEKLLEKKDIFPVLLQSV